MKMPQRTWCETEQAFQPQEAAKYRNSSPISNEIPVEKPKLLQSILKSSSSPSPEKCPVNHSANIEEDVSLEVLQAAEKHPEESRSLEPPVTVADECSVPLDHWTRLAQQTGTRPAVDELTISRYSPAEWRLRNETITKDAREADRNAKNIVFTAGLVDGRVYAPIDKHEVDNRVRLQERACTVYHWKVELERNNEEVTAEIANIQQVIQRLMRSARAVQLIKNIDGDIQKVRNMRLEPDLVHDSVSEEVIKEEALCSELINLYTRCIDEVKKQIQELKDAKRRLEHVWSDKKDAYDIDTTCLGLNTTSSTLQWKPGSVQLPAGQSTPAGNEYFVKESIMFLQASLARSRILRANIKDIISKAVEDLRSQAISVEMALTHKINKTVQARRELERTLAQCLKSLTNTETVFTKISTAVRKLDAPMKCAQTRLDMRSERRNVEQCRDIPHFGLIDEVKGISESVSDLMSHVKGAEDSMEVLTKSRQKIEKEITVKQKTLWVDGERCRLMRSFYPSNQALFGYK